MKPETLAKIIGSFNVLLGINNGVLALRQRNRHVFSRIELSEVPHELKPTHFYKIGPGGRKPFDQAGAVTYSNYVWIPSYFDLFVELDPMDKATPKNISMTDELADWFLGKLLDDVKRSAQALYDDAQQRRHEEAVDKIIKSFYGKFDNGGFPVLIDYQTERRAPNLLIDQAIAEVSMPRSQIF